MTNLPRKGATNYGHVPAKSITIAQRCDTQTIARMRWIVLALIAAPRLASCVDAGLSRCANGRVCPGGIHLHRCARLLRHELGRQLRRFVRRQSEECDDGNQLSHDGCSSNCLSETPVWRGAPTSRRAFCTRWPTTRIAAASSCSAASMRSSVLLGDTLERDGAMLAHADAGDVAARASQRRDGLRFAHAHRVAIRRPRRRTAFGDTWQWDGNNWTPLGGPGAIGFHQLHTMAVDPTVNRVVTFGGGVDVGVSPKAPTRFRAVVRQRLGCAHRDDHARPAGRMSPRDDPSVPTIPAHLCVRWLRIHRCAGDDAWRRNGAEWDAHIGVGPERALVSRDGLRGRWPL